MLLPIAWMDLDQIGASPRDVEATGFELEAALAMRPNHTCPDIPSIPSSTRPAPPRPAPPRPRIHIHVRFHIHTHTFSRSAPVSSPEKFWP